MKKLLAAALAAFMAVIMTACSTSQTSGTDFGITTVTPGKLTIATSPDFAPMEFVDASKEGQDKFVASTFHSQSTLQIISDLSLK